MIDLNEKQLKILKDILQRHIPNRRVVAFGSRVTQKAKQYSDIELWIGQQLHQSLDG